MKTDNKFYIFKQIDVIDSIVPNYSYDLSTGEYSEVAGNSIILKYSSMKANRCIISFSGVYTYAGVAMLLWNTAGEYKGYIDVISQTSADDTELTIDIPEQTGYIGFQFRGTNISSYKSYTKKYGYLVNPHYKQLKKKYSKENGQMFFRESLDGKINLFGSDYNIIKNASLEETLQFVLYKNNSIYINASFNKSDCKFDNAKKNVELKLDYSDKYSKILNAYENTYDLIKLAPAITPLILTKRCVVQLYIQGENVLSNYAGGTYWETEVDEPIDDQDALLRRYYFSKGPSYSEINLQGFNYDINASYRIVPTNNIWNSICETVVDGVKYEIPCSIVFNKVYDADELVPNNYTANDIHILSNDSLGGTYIPQQQTRASFLFDTYKIEIWTGHNGTGHKIYQSEKLYGKDRDFSIASGENLYHMVKIDQQIPLEEPIPVDFYLGADIIEHQIWGRLLCDVSSIVDEGETVVLYDLPYDDFATPRRNYKKCIGLKGFDSENSVVQIWQTDNSSDTPTSYGINDFRKYFVPPYTLYGQYFYPLARNSWVNTSMWAKLGVGTSEIASFEQYCSKYYREYILKNSYHIGDVIKAILYEIDPSIKHEKTTEYSSFLYGHLGGTAEALGNCDVYITQKTNILKGEYDQAAQKAEIKLEQIMAMLRDCFRCYWFIDSQNRFRIEHVSYFMNGLSYSSASIQLDLTQKFDKFNKKLALYCQQETEFDKSDLSSRYEFSWMDDATKAMGGDLVVNIKNKYIKEDKTDEIAINSFTSDVDYMLFLPDDFSNDGFALLLADSNKKVPILQQNLKDEKQYGRTFQVYIQNWYASFNQLIKHYMDDMSGNNIEYNNLEEETLQVTHIKRCNKHIISFPANSFTIDIYRLIQTEIGLGHIESFEVNIDTNLASVELRYEPG